MHNYAIQVIVQIDGTRGGDVRASDAGPNPDKIQASEIRS